MPIKDLQVGMRELGRIRMGEKRPTKSGKGTFPSKLTTWRLTSPSERLLLAVAEKYGGGPVTPWEDDRAPGKQFQVTLATDTLEIIVPTGDVGSQWWERWSADGCLRRCDGEYDTVTGRKCDCPADLEQRAAKAAKGGACKPTTRVSLILVGCPEVGLWRVQSTGKNAAKEMRAIAQVCELATRQGRVIPGSLRLEQRQAKRPGEATSHFVVPVLEVNHGFDEILRTLGMLDDSSFAPSIAAPSRPALPEARPELPPDPGFKQATGPVGSPPRPPVPAPAHVEPDDEVAEAEVVDDGGRSEPTSAEGASSHDEAVSPSDAVEIVEEGGGGIDHSATPPSGDEWDAKRWQAEAKARGITRRDLILAARDLTTKSVTSFADLTDPDVAPALRAWLDEQGA